jgi:hypothetical protein
MEILVHDQMSMAVPGFHTSMLVQDQLGTTVPDIQKSMPVLGSHASMLVPGGLVLADAEGSSQAYRSKPVKQGDVLDAGVSSDRRAATWDVDQTQDCGGCPWSGWLGV